MTTDTEILPVLYILMRNDLASMNPGKAMAQAAHASNDFVSVYTAIMTQPLESYPEEKRASTAIEQLKMEIALGQWTNQATTFGTVLTLAVNEKEMRQTIDIASTISRIFSGIVHDPTYPLVDGETVHYIPLDTCAYVFGDKNDPIMELLLSHFPLHP